MNKHCLKDHYEILKRDWIPCPSCHLYFRNQQGLTAHTHQKHPKDETKIEVQCVYCSKIFEGTETFYLHANQFHMDEIQNHWYLDIEQKMFYPKPPDKKKKHRSSKDGFQCSFCPKIFTTIDPLYQHANRYHLEDIEKQWFYNPLQKMYYPKPLDVNKKHNHGPVIWCEFCTAKVHYSYVPHANKYHSDIISKIWPGCEDCKMYFPTIQSLDSHNLAKHKVSTSSFRNRKLTPGRKVTTCEFCPRSFVIARLCWKHAQREHPEIISQLWLKCNVCDLHFPNIEVLTIHIKAKHNRKKTEEKESSPKCEFCPSSFSSIHICTRHANASHPDLVKEKWHKCPVCDYYLQTESALALHKGKHDETCSKKIVCHFCPSRFHYQKTYAMHANKCHIEYLAKEWRFCEPCTLFFPPDNHKHFQEPAPTVETVCVFCSQTFKLSKDHIQHCNSMHQSEICKTWFECEMCHEFNPSVKALSRHQKSLCSRLPDKKKQVRKRRTKKEVDHAEEEGADIKDDSSKRPKRASSKKINYDLDDCQVDIMYEDEQVLSSKCKKRYTILNRIFGHGG